MAAGFYDPGMTSIGQVIRKPGADPEFSFRGVLHHSGVCQVIQGRGQVIKGGGA